MAPTSFCHNKIMGRGVNPNQDGEGGWGGLIYPPSHPLGFPLITQNR